jgi:hypothetical protein
LKNQITDDYQLVCGNLTKINTYFSKYKFSFVLHSHHYGLGLYIIQYNIQYNIYGYLYPKYNSWKWPKIPTLTLFCKKSAAKLS